MRWALYKSLLLFIAACCPAATLDSENVSESVTAVVTLREKIIVRRSRIRFSDLLPADADKQLKQSAATLDLGPAPEPGSFRVFRAEELRNKVGKRLKVQIPKMVVVHAAGFPIEVAALKRALAEYTAHPDGIDDAAISFPLELVTRAPNPGFRVASLAPGADAYSATAFMQCQLPRECGPFALRLAFLRPIHWARGEKQKLRVKAGPIQVGTVLVRPGRLATLVLHDAGLRISMQVLALQRAGMGASVRVLDKVSRRIYLARVSGEDQVVAHLEEKR